MKHYLPILLMAFLVLAIALGFIVHTNLSSSSESGAVGSQPARPAQYMNVSAYCPGPCCCSSKWADGYTASGVPAVGKIVAAPKRFPYGTILSIPGYSKGAVVQDRGGAITGNKIDVLFPTHQEALNWGRQYLMVKIIE